MLRDVISPEDYEVLSKVEMLFNEKLSIDVKAFVLAMLKVSYQDIQHVLM